MKSTLNDLFQASLVFGLMALFGTAVIADLQSPSQAQTSSQVAQNASPHDRATLTVTARG